MPLTDLPVQRFIARCLLRRAQTLSLGNYQIDFVPGGTTLVVSFEPAAPGKAETGMERLAWGHEFLQKRGHSVLGVKRVHSDWYRGADLHAMFRTCQSRGLFMSFERVVFYGASMGGYAALAFADSAPGCVVLAMNPQSTLAPDRVWFDQRFAGPQARLWEGDFVDGADTARAAARVYVCYDPYELKDRLHADRLPAHNTMRLRLPFVGHTTPYWLKTMGVLDQVFDTAVAGTLSEPWFRVLAQGRSQLSEYHLNLARRGRHLPRRLRQLERALELSPKNARALALRQTLVPAPPAPGEAPAPVRRWLPGIVTAPRVPLVYLNIPKAAGTTIQNHMVYIARGSYSTRPGDVYGDPALHRSRDTADASHITIDHQLRTGALVFTFVRDPGRRAYACFNEKIVHRGRHSFGAIRQELQEKWGLALPPEGEVPTLEAHRRSFCRFLDFVAANLEGQTPIRRDPHWSPQSPMLARYRKQLKVDLVGRVEHFVEDMALVLHRAGVWRVPDLQYWPHRHSPAPFAFDDVLTPEVQERLDKLYEEDYASLGYR